MKIFSIVLFALMVVAQWFVPVSMIVDMEEVRHKGKLFRFETQPIDPTDPFRGKYITLYYKLSTYDTKESHWKDDSDVYVVVTDESSTLAQIVRISETPPTDTKDYFKAKIAAIQYDTQLAIEFPFERFYLEESKAQPAETIYNDNNRDEKRKPAYAEVYVYDGKVYLADVKIDGVSIVDIVKRQAGN